MARDITDKSLGEFAFVAEVFEGGALVAASPMGNMHWMWRSGYMGKDLARRGSA
jgi:hypothetical protein